MEGNDLLDSPKHHCAPQNQLRPIFPNVSCNNNRTCNDECESYSAFQINNTEKVENETFLSENFENKVGNQDFSSGDFPLPLQSRHDPRLVYGSLQSPSTFVSASVLRPQKVSKPHTRVHSANIALLGESEDSNGNKSCLPDEEKYGWGSKRSPAFERTQGHFYDYYRNNVCANENVFRKSENELGSAAACDEITVMVPKEDGSIRLEAYGNFHSSKKGMLDATFHDEFHRNINLVDSEKDASKQRLYVLDSVPLFCTSKSLPQGQEAISKNFSNNASKSMDPKAMTRSCSETPNSAPASMTSLPCVSATKNFLYESSSNFPQHSNASISHNLQASHPSTISHRPSKPLARSRNAQDVFTCDEIATPKISHHLSLERQINRPFPERSHSVTEAKEFLGSVENREQGSRSQGNMKCATPNNANGEVQSASQVSSISNRKWVECRQAEELMKPHLYADRQVLVDIDDTIRSSGGVRLFSVSLGGVDTQYERGQFYPGVFQFLLELSICQAYPNTKFLKRPLSLAVLTARIPQVPITPDSIINCKLQETAIRRGIRGWGINTETKVLYSTLNEWVFPGEKARKKFENLMLLHSRLSSVQPQINYVWVGDTGEMDRQAGEMMASEIPQKICAVFLHYVQYSGRMSNKCPPDYEMNGVPFVFFKTYVKAARRAYDLNLISRKAVARVIAQAVQDLEQMDVPSISTKWRDLIFDVRDAEGIVPLKEATVRPLVITREILSRRIAEIKAALERLRRSRADQQQNKQVSVFQHEVAPPVRASSSPLGSMNGSMNQPIRKGPYNDITSSTIKRELDERNASKNIEKKHSDEDKELAEHLHYQDVSTPSFTHGKKEFELSDMPCRLSNHNLTTDPPHFPFTAHTDD